MCYSLMISDDKAIQPDVVHMFLSKSPAFQLAKEIRDLMGQQETNVILINIEAKLAGHARQAHVALDLLLYLRCEHEFRNPVICVGFEPLSAILNRKPENLILCSLGTRYLQLPLQPEADALLTPPVIEKHHIKLLKKYIKGSFSMEQFRHREANWWGIFTQWRIHKHIYPEFNKPVPLFITNKNHEARNVVAKFLYAPEDLLVRVEPGIIDKIKENQQHLRRTPPRILHIDDQSKDGWSEIFQYIIYGNEMPDTFQSLTINPDDNVEIIFERLINLLEQDTGIKPLFNPDLILLDVRLLPVSDNDEKEVKKMSGPSLLVKIRKKYLGIPIIITTASNKVWTYQELMSLGADAYWIKEGLDEQRTLHESTHNYYRFLELLTSLLREEYKLLKVMTDAVARLKSRQNSWENKKWDIKGILKPKKGMKNYQGPRPSAHTRTHKDQLIKMYNDGIDLYRDFLSTKILNTGFKISTENDWFYYSSIIVHFGKTVELIHEFSSELFKAYGSFYKIQDWRNDETGLKLYGMRNMAAHNDKSHTITFQDFNDYITDINNYLLT